MKTVFLSFMLAIFLTATSTGQKTLTVEDYDRAAEKMWWNVYPKTDNLNISPRWLDNGNFYYVSSTEGVSTYVYVQAKNGKKKTFQDADTFKEFLSDKRTPNPETTRNENLSPDKSKVVYIKDWNLYVRDLSTGKEKQLTTDGIKNFGYATDNAGWTHSDAAILKWSPDSKMIATFQQDQRHVSNMYMVNTVIGESTLDEWKYPLPQDEDIIRIHRVIIDVNSGKMVRLKMDSDPRRGTLCDDIACSGEFDDNYWSPDQKTLAFVSSSRDHKVAELKIADVKTGKVRSVLKETVETQYESGQGAINWFYLPNSNNIIWYSERDNWGHLYMYDLQGKLLHQITKGDFVVTSVLRVEEENKVIYFEANGREKGRNPYFSHLYKINFDGSGMQLLTPEDANHRISLGDGSYFVDSYSTPVTPPVTILRNLEGKEIDVLEKGNIDRLKASGWEAPMEIITKSDDGDYDLYGLLFKPSWAEKGVKYPVVNYVYPGPQSGGVGSRSFAPSRVDHQALAELGFVVVVIDGTCNPGRSKKFHDVCYGSLSVNTLPDQVAGIKELAKKYDFIDIERVGIWGHSGGGSATADALFSYPDFYKVGVAQSGNHDNRNYEDDWAERYVGLMTYDAEGNDSYADQANHIYADQLQGKLLIAHGALDDNVPISHSYLVVEALIKANKDFDLIVFPNARHGYGKSNNYMTRRRWDYFVQHLQGNVPPAQYELTR